jgi:hypothetical protein
MEKKWAELRTINYHLSTICTAITLSEELLAVVASLEYCDLFNKVERKALRLKEEEIISTFTKQPWYFKEEHFQAFKKVWRWANDEEMLIIYLGIYLQGIKECRSPRGISINNATYDRLLVVDSAKRCRILAEYVNTMNSGKELLAWLTRTLHGSQELNAFISVGLSLKYEKEWSKVNKSLWVLMEGGAEQEIIADCDKANTYPLRDLAPDRVMVILYPQELNKEWYFIRCVLPNTECDTGMEVEIDAILQILIIDSLLQQLFSGNGICCPFYKPSEGCRCHQPWKESLSRIAQWANQGHFGRDTWNDLPQECRPCS